MAKIKLTKGELKRRRDALRQFERYLPTLQLKKQQLQIEILHQLSVLQQREAVQESKRTQAQSWSGLLVEPGLNLQQWISLKQTLVNTKNIAGVDIDIFDHLDFPHCEYDLFTNPLWADNAIEALKELVSLQEEIKIIKKGIMVLRQELRMTTQRVNLFEKVKIPEAKEAIRLIRIYIGDQMTNAVGRSKIAKKKIESLIFEGALA